MVGRGAMSDDVDLDSILDNALNELDDAPATTATAPVTAASNSSNTTLPPPTATAAPTAVSAPAQTSTSTSTSTPTSTGTSSAAAVAAAAVEALSNASANPAAASASPNASTKPVAADGQTPSIEEMLREMQGDELGRQLLSGLGNPEGMQTMLQRLLADAGAGAGAAGGVGAGNGGAGAGAGGKAVPPFAGFGADMDKPLTPEEEAEFKAFLGQVQAHAAQFERDFPKTAATASGTGTGTGTGTAAGVGAAVAPILASSTAATTTASSSSSSSTTPAPTAATAPTSAPDADFARGVEQAMKMISDGFKTNANASAAEGGKGVSEDEMVSKLMSQFAGMDPGALDAFIDRAVGDSSATGAAGGAGPTAAADMKEMDKLVAGMMGQMMSKDYLYPPIKDLTAKYPGWLAANKAKLSDADYTNYQKQAECFARMCTTFEKTPNDSTRVLALMQEVQGYGAPPKEIAADFMKADPSNPFDLFGGASAASAGAGAGAGKGPVGTGASAGAAGIPPFPRLPGMPGMPGMPPMNEAELAKLMAALSKDAGPDDCKMQ